LREFGAPEVFALHEIELPWPGGADDVLVRMEAASIPLTHFFVPWVPTWVTGQVSYWAMMALASWRSLVMMSLR